MFIITLTIAFIIYHFAAPKTIENYPPSQSDLKCNECLRIYFPLCASDNQTYTNECRFRCVQSKRKPAKRATIVRYGPCILGARRNGPAALNLSQAITTEIPLKNATKIY
ncbi:hypothetical protein PYW07_010466 [Mythimna separata]|uniref:Kazal-like domain-containing protein n=1 Tax=Mythimna separata TaxID=271217 RepID=A0AAD7Y9V9_MYTSE|nr:hypothetical protein PYW07_010466 [Mythimna separata]